MDAQDQMDHAPGTKVVRQTVVNGSSGAQEVYRYDEECVDGVIVPKAVKVGECGRTGILKANSHLFPDPHRWNYWGCPLRLEVAEFALLRIVTPRPDGGYTLTGTSSPLAFYLAKKLNATLEVLPTVKDKDTLQFNDFTVTETSEDYDFGPTYYRSCVAFFVPSGKGDTASIFSLVYREFPPAVWALVGVACFVSILFLTLTWQGITANPFQRALLYVVSTLAETPMLIQPDLAARVRVFTVFWLMFCIVMSTAYQSVLHSLQTAPQEPLEINTLSALAESKLFIQGQKMFVRQLKLAAEDLEGNSTLLTLSDRSWIQPETNVSVRQVALKRNVALLCPLDLVSEYIRFFEGKSGKQLVHQIPEFCISNTYMAYFRFPRGSLITHTLNNVVTRALDSGILQHINKQRVYRRPEVKQRWKPIAFSGVYAVFQLLFFGLGLASLSFIIEFFNT